MSNSARKDVFYIEQDRSYIFQCPHCELYIQVSEAQINCQIFRHGVLISTGEQVNPHASKEECDRLVENNLVNGCCRPFKLFLDSSGIVKYADKCEYI